MTHIVLRLTLIVLFFTLSACGGGGGGGSGIVDEVSDNASFSSLPDPEKVVIDPNGGVYPVNELLITFKDDVTRKETESLIQSIGGSVIGYTPSIELYQVEVPTSSIAELDALIQQLEADSSIDIVVKNNAFHLHVVPSDLNNLKTQDSNLVLAYENVGVEEAWQAIDSSGVTLSPIKIGMVDTGIDAKHPEFSGVNVIGVQNDPGAKSVCGSTISHGTEVSGIIGANNISSAANNNYVYPHMNGVVAGAPSIQYSLIVDSMSFAGDIIQHIDSVVDKGADIVNLSLGATKCGFINSATEFLDFFDLVVADQCCSVADAFDDQKALFERLLKRRSNTLFVASAGNDDESADINLPGGAISLPNLITVGATSSSGRRASFSNWGPSVDVAAPGEGVFAPSIYTAPLDVTDYRNLSHSEGYFFEGTSASAPFVTGVAGLIKAIKPELTPSEIKQIIIQSAVPIQTGETGKDIGSGCYMNINSAGSTGCLLSAIKAVCDPRVLMCTVARDDSVTAQSGFPIHVDVLANDTVVNAGQTKLENITQGSSGSVQLSQIGVIYTPNAGFTGTDNFNYTITDSSGLESTASVTVTVIPAIFSIGDGVEVSTNVDPNAYVLAMPNGGEIGTQQPGSQGVIIGGVEWEAGQWWWQVDFSSGADGWVAEYSIQKLGSVPPVTVSLEAVPSSIVIGESATLNWSSTNSISCAGEGFTSDGSTNGGVSVSPTETTTYTLTCSGPAGPKRPLQLLQWDLFNPTLDI